MAEEPTFEEEQAQANAAAFALAEEGPNEMKLAVTAWVFKHLGSGPIKPVADMTIS